MGKFEYSIKRVIVMEGGEILTRDPKPMSCRRRAFGQALARWVTGKKGEGATPGFFFLRVFVDYSNKI